MLYHKHKFLKNPGFLNKKKVLNQNNITILSMLKLDKVLL